MRSSYNSELPVPTVNLLRLIRRDYDVIISCVTSVEQEDSRGIL